MSRFLNPRYADFDAYVPGEQPQNRQYIKLNTNESPFPPSEGVMQAVNRTEIANLRLYSDPECRRLREKLAELYGVSPDNLFLSNGSDDILNFSFMAFTPDGTATFPDITYGFYSVFADLHKVRYATIPLKDDFSIDPADYENRQQMIVIANPNAPTGRSLPLSAIERILQTNPDRVVVIDEAYVDFGGESCYPLIKKYKNLLVVQTYSKSRSMAGARLGFAIADKELIADLNKIKYSTNPYNINRLTLVAGEAAVDDDAYYKENCQTIIRTRAYTTQALEQLGFTVIPSQANFVFVKCPRLSGEALYEALKENGILVRHFTVPRIKDFNRITIGTKQDMETLIGTIKTILEG